MHTNTCTCVRMSHVRHVHVHVHVHVVWCMCMYTLSPTDDAPDLSPIPFTERYFQMRPAGGRESLRDTVIHV